MMSPTRPLIAETIAIASLLCSLSKRRSQSFVVIQRPRKLLGQVRDAIRLKHHAYSTEKTYVYWVKRFSLHHNKRHPLEMGEKGSASFSTT
jgi:hypothetical protein